MAKNFRKNGFPAAHMGGQYAKATAGRMLYLKAIVIIVASISVLTIGLIALDVWERNNGDFPEQEQESNSIVHNGITYFPKENIETFLVLGLDTIEGATSDSYNNNKRADFLMLFIFDNETKQCTALQINRDTITKVNVLGVAGDKVGTVPMQIALAHTYGHGGDISCRNTANAVSSLLNDIHIDHYISVTMEAVPTLNDLVGGVEVTLLADFTHIDPSMTKGETVTLMGDQALKYVQIRQGLEDETNSTRMERQQQYVDALYDRFQSSMRNDSNFAVEATTAISDYIVSDRSITQLQKLAEKFNEYTFLGVRNIEGTSSVVDGLVEFLPNNASIQQTVIDLFYKPED